MVHNGKNGIVGAISGEARDEVHHHLLEGLSFFPGGDFVDGSALLVGEDFCLLA